MTFKQQCFLKIYELTEKGREGGRGEGRLVNFKNFLMALKYCFFYCLYPSIAAMWHWQRQSQISISQLEYGLLCLLGDGEDLGAHRVTFKHRQATNKKIYDLGPICLIFFSVHCTLCPNEDSWLLFSLVVLYYHYYFKFSLIIFLSKHF